MLFNSYEFVFVFLPATLAVLFVLSSLRFRMEVLWLSAASLFFYAWWSPRWTLLLAGSIIANFLFAKAISNRSSSPSRRMLLISALVFNLGLLGIFKYANFALTTFGWLVGRDFGHLDITLPIGISFYTFTQIAFLVDIYVNAAEEYDLGRYVLFVTYFPHLIAGPILHHKEMMPQFGSPKTFKPRIANMTIGLTIFSIGLAKKVILADSFSDWATVVFDSAGAGFEPHFTVAWIGALSYTLQIYFDFSGYSDMAIGISRMFGIKLPINFNSPYKALNIVEFWRRWHMTLSRFLRDYLYIPLGGNRRGKLRRYMNLFVTMLLGGLWHGANWTFVLWGALHGLYLVCYYVWINLTGQRSRAGEVGSSGIRRFCAWSLTFIAVVFAWVLFRAPTAAVALDMLRGMVGLNGIHLPDAIGDRFDNLMQSISLSGITVSRGAAFTLGGQFVFGDPAELLFLFAIASIVLAGPNAQQLLGGYEPALGAPTTAGTGILRVGWRTGVLTGMLLALSLMMLNKNTVFLYFQF